MKIQLMKLVNLSTIFEVVQIGLFELQYHCTTLISYYKSSDFKSNTSELVSISTSQIQEKDPFLLRPLQMVLQNALAFSCHTLIDFAILSCYTLPKKIMALSIVPHIP